MAALSVRMRHWQNMQTGWMNFYQNTVSPAGAGLEGEIAPEKLHEIIQTEIGLVFMEVLKDAGVYKCTEEGRAAFVRFVDTVNK